ncbi:hypothetical protein HK104_008582 [Borealophlyctis nickersoniae]|nr:hypothetical protein HK104_008582 [Borealophlyctis nickersoniae]
MSHLRGPLNLMNDAAEIITTCSQLLSDPQACTEAEARGAVAACQRWLTEHSSLLTSGPSRQIPTLVKASQIRRFEGPHHESAGALESEGREKVALDDGVVGSGATGNKRKRANATHGGSEGGEEMEGSGTGDIDTAVVKKQKRRKKRKRRTDVTRATLLGVCEVEVDILIAILNYLRSRFDYTCLGTSCKTLHRAMMQTPVHCKWFVQYCRQGFAVADGEEYHPKESPYCQIDETDAARLTCSYRNLIEIGELCNFGTVLRSFGGATDILYAKEFRSLSKFRNLPLSSIALLSRVLRNRGDSHDRWVPMSKYFEPAGWVGNGFQAHDVRLLSHSNLFEAGDRLMVVMQQKQHQTGPSRYVMQQKQHQTGPYLEAVDQRRRLLVGTFWGKVHLPNGDSIVDKYPFTTLFTILGDTTLTEFYSFGFTNSKFRFNRCKFRIDMDGSGMLEPMIAPKVVFSVGKDNNG